MAWIILRAACGLAFLARPQAVRKSRSIAMLGPMLGFGWLTLRQAQEALKGGRLDDAQRLLAEPGVQGNKRTWEVLQLLARAFAERGDKHLHLDDVAGAWADLLKAE